MVLVFVYGILVGRPEYGGVPAVLEGYERFVRGHASIRKNGGCYVSGELLDVDDVTLALFDRVEGVAAGYYHRFKVTVFDLDETPHEAWVYQQVADRKSSLSPNCFSVTEQDRLGDKSE